MQKILPYVECAAGTLANRSIAGPKMSGPKKVTRQIWTLHPEELEVKYCVVSIKTSVRGSGAIAWSALVLTSIARARGGDDCNRAPTTGTQSSEFPSDEWARTLFRGVRGETESFVHNAAGMAGSV